MNEVEISLEVGGVDDADDAVRLNHVGAAAKEHIANNRLVGRTRRKRIGAGQIDDGDRAAVLRVSGAGLFLDSNARVVADLLPQAGERIEERTLAAVGVADEGVDR